MVCLVLDRVSEFAMGDRLRRQFRFVPEPGAPAQARETIREMLGQRVRQEIVDRTMLMVSELVTNSVRHGGLGPSDRIELRLDLEGGLRVEVVDPGDSFTPRRRELAQPGGWGLVVVEQLAERWGVVRTDATCVWFEVPVAGGIAAAADANQRNTERSRSDDRAGGRA
jgi:serine/threonine-protein kinase RsbW